MRTVLSVRRIVVGVHVDAFVNMAMTQLPSQHYKARVLKNLLRSVHESVQACEGLCLHSPLRTMTQREKTQRVAPCSLRRWERLSSDGAGSEAYFF